MKKELLLKRNQISKIWKILPICKNMTKLVLKKTFKGVAEKPFDEEIMSVTDGLNQPSQQKPGIEMSLYQKRHCQFELKGRENRRHNEGSLLELLDPTGPDHTVICY